MGRLRERVCRRAGHYGVVRKGQRKSDGVRVAVKTIPKRRAVYVSMLRNEITILRCDTHTVVLWGWGAVCVSIQHSLSPHHMPAGRWTT